MSNDLRTASELALNPISGQRDWLRGSPSPPTHHLLIFLETRPHLNGGGSYRICWTSWPHVPVVRLTDGSSGLSLAACFRCVPAVSAPLIEGLRALAGR